MLKIINIKNAIILIAFFLFFTENIKSQQLKIEVFSENDNTPLPYAHICTENLISKEKEYKATDKERKIIIHMSEKVIISISYTGYETIIDTIPTGVSSKIYNLKISSDIEEVVITGQNKPISIDKSIYNIKLISKEKIKLQASNNPAELFKNELNISINNDPSTGSSIKLQGISGENVKILIDGVPVIGRMDGDIDLSQINLDDVHHIEIVEGPMSVMYGSNALAGVINIITKENKYAKLKAGIDTYYESIGTYNANGNVYFRKKKSSIGLNFGRNFFEGYSPDKNSRS